MFSPGAPVGFSNEIERSAINKALSTKAQKVGKSVDELFAEGYEEYFKADEARRGAIRGISGEPPHFAPISARLAELSLSVSDVTILGHSARSYARWAWSRSPSST